MRGSLRNFYARCTDYTALALSIFVFLILMAVAVIPALADSSPANSDEKISLTATAKTPPVNDGKPETIFEIKIGDTTFVFTDQQHDFSSPETQ